MHCKNRKCLQHTICPNNYNSYIIIANATTTYSLLIYTKLIQKFGACFLLPWPLFELNSPFKLIRVKPEISALSMSPLVSACSVHLWTHLRHAIMNASAIWD